MSSGSGIYFSRAGWAATDGISVRVPELHPLRDRTIAQFGVGCLGGPSALEFARAGIGELRILDDDHVDPATIARWPFGLSAAGSLKVQVIGDFIKKNYPTTQVSPMRHRLGATRRTRGEAPSDHEVIEQMTAGASILFDATAEVGVQHYLSDVAARLGIPYVSVVGTYGGWGGEVVCITPGRTEGCWMCYRCAIEDGSIPVCPSDPNGRIQPRGCGDVTFTATGFDMTQVALMAVRTAVAGLCRDATGGYPAAPWDVLTLKLRDESGQLIVPETRGHYLRKHARCPRCNDQ